MITPSLAMEHHIMSRLYMQLRRHIPCTRVGRCIDYGPHKINLIEDRDSLHKFIVSTMNPKEVLIVQEFALDEFDRLLTYIETT